MSSLAPENGSQIFVVDCKKRKNLLEKTSRRSMLFTSLLGLHKWCGDQNFGTGSADGALCTPLLE